MNRKGKIDIRVTLLTLCFLSGFSALVYEVVWVRILTLVFGTTISAVAIVVAVFLGGLGIGSIYFGKQADKTNNHLRLFSYLEFGIGGTVLIILLVFDLLPELYRAIYISLNTSQISITLIAVISILVMLVPTFLMGGTLPLLSKIYIRKQKNVGKGVGILYAINTLGSIIGVFLTGFFLIAYFGQSATQIIAITINLMVGGVAVLLSQKYRVLQHREKIDAPASSYPGYIGNIILGAITIAGFCGLAYEILWTRSLHIFLANSTYSFTSVLIVFLAGIGLGSFLYSRYLKNKKPFILLLSICQGGIGVYTIITALFLNALPRVLFAIKHVLNIPILRIMLPGLLLSLVIVLIPTLLMGITFPLVCKIYTDTIRRLGQSVGRVYFANTAGNIIGSLVAGFILISVFGIIKGIIFVAFINIGLGFFLLVFEPHLLNKRRYYTAYICLIAIVLFVAHIAAKNPMVLPPSIFRTPARSDKILYYNETPEGTVIVNEDRFTGIRACYVNNSPVCGTTYDALKVVKMLGHLPLLANPDAHNVLIIGFGTGITASAAAQHELDRIDCVEICPGVKQAAQFFSNFNRNVLRDPRVRFIENDGRNYVLLTKKKYDVISCDPTHPTLGCNNLYTREYFTLCKKILNKNGVICQYLPLHKLSPAEFKTLIKTFYSVFPHTTVWLAHSHGILLATDHKLIIDFLSLSEMLHHIEENILTDPYLFAASLIFDEEAVKRFTEDARINTDEHPYLEFFTKESIERENWDINLTELIKRRIDPLTAIANISDKEKMARYLQAQKYFLRALVYKNRGYKKGVIESFRKAFQINPENNEIKLFLEHEMRQPPGSGKT
jgi:spermidine synthase